MERVAFLIEKTGQRIECLLNPASVTITRQAGLRTRRCVGGAVTGVGASDDSVLATGGGITHVQMELLFDLSKVAGPKPPEDVRELTLPLWNLAENSDGNGNSADDGGALPLVRFVWGKSWNIPGVVAAVAERFDYFTASGIAQRSWVSLRFLRVNVDGGARQGFVTPAAPAMAALQADLPGTVPVLSADPAPNLQSRTHLVSGETAAGPAGGPDPGAAERIDQLAYRYYGDPALWRLLATANALINPAAMIAGMVLRVPALTPPASPSVTAALAPTLAPTQAPMQASQPPPAGAQAGMRP